MERFAGNSVEGTPISAASDNVIGTVRELIAMMGKGGISELDLSTGELSIRLRGVNGSGPAGNVQSAPANSATESASLDEGHQVTAPMIGTFYASPSPGEGPFVQVGDEVEVGQVVGIIEAMKIMNEIISDRAGVVTEVMVENAQAVEYGFPLIRLADASDALA